MKRKHKHLLQLAIGIAVSALALYIVFKGVSLKDLGTAFGSVNYWWVIPNLAVFYFGMWLRGVRWSALFAPNYKVPVFDTTGGMFICFGFNSIFPARAGEFARAYLIGKRHGMGFSTAFGTVVAERTLDAVTLLPCLVAALAITPIAPDAFPFQRDILGVHINMTQHEFMGARNMAIVLAGLLLVGIVLVSVARTRGMLLRLMHTMTFVPQGLRDRVEALVHKFAEGLSSFRSPGRVAWLFGLSLAVWLTNAGSLWFMAKGFAFHNPMQFVQAFATVVIACIFITLCPTPGYWGFLEAGFIFSLLIMGIEKDPALALCYAFLMHLCQWVPMVAIGLPWAWIWHVSVGEVEQAEEEAEKPASPFSA
jgi:uncharacterized protein (TIRG00374 family)